MGGEFVRCGSSDARGAARNQDSPGNGLCHKNLLEITMVCLFVEQAREGVMDTGKATKLERDW
jgi:hypothetical protein